LPRTRERMKLGTRSRYSVRLLVALARAGLRPVSLGEIAAAEGISRSYLARLVGPLVDAKLVESRRGSKGGYVLAKPPDQVLLHEVVAAAGATLSGIPCLESPDGCARVRGCAAGALWRGVSGAVEVFLRGQTLGDLLTDTEGGAAHGGQ
jgi:Rrf2 family cysteine metabolism transcriptional repressor